MIFILQGSEKVCFQGCVNSLPQQEERSSNLGIELLPSPVRIWRLSSIRDVSLSLVSSRSATSLVFKYSSEVELAWGLALCIKWVGPATGSTLHSTQMAVDCLSASQLDYLLLFSMHLMCQAYYSLKEQYDHAAPMACRAGPRDFHQTWPSLVRGRG